jgi:hypothetical protein
VTTAAAKEPVRKAGSATLEPVTSAASTEPTTTTPNSAAAGTPDTTVLTRPTPAAGPGAALGAEEPIPSPPIVPALAATQTGTVGDAYLSGLINVNIQNLNLQAQDVIDVSNVLNSAELQVLVQALTSNTAAEQNSARLTDAMQNTGQLTPNEVVVGRTPDGQVLKAQKS